MEPSAIRHARPDFLMWACVLALCLMGLVVLYGLSASPGEGSQPLFRRQVRSVLVGFLAMFFSYSLELELWRKGAKFCGFLALLLGISVFVPGLGLYHGGSYRWVRIPMVGGSFQVLDVMSFLLVVHFARYFSDRSEAELSSWHGFRASMKAISLPVVLVFLQPDLGGAVWLGATALFLYVIAGGSLVGSLSLVALSPLLLGLAIWMKPYRFRRFMSFWDPWSDPSGSGFQLVQGLLAYALGGLWGVGLGQSKQKFYYLPAAHTDFILAVLGEEMGLMAVSFVLFLYFVLFARASLVVLRQRDRFAFLLGAGVVVSLVLQTLINLGGVTALFPLTGLPLPFLSYGGSSLVASFAKVGLLLRLSTLGAGSDPEGGVLS